jgi:hypothetical protein
MKAGEGSVIDLTAYSLELQCFRNCIHVEVRERTPAHLRITDVGAVHRCRDSTRIGLTFAAALMVSATTQAAAAIAVQMAFAAQLK